MEKSTKKEITKYVASVAIVGATCAALYMHGKYKIVNPFVRIDQETNEDTNELPVQEGLVVVPSTEIEPVEKTAPVITEEQNKVQGDEVEPIIGTAATEVLDTEGSTYTYTDTYTYTYTPEELQAMFPPIVIDNSGNVLYESSVVISENPEQHIISSTSSISGGEELYSYTETYYDEEYPVKARR